MSGLSSQYFMSDMMHACCWPVVPNTVECAAHKACQAWGTLLIQQTAHQHTLCMSTQLSSLAVLAFITRGFSTLFCCRSPVRGCSGCVAAAFAIADLVVEQLSVWDASWTGYGFQ